MTSITAHKTRYPRVFTFCAGDIAESEQTPSIPSDTLKWMMLFDAVAQRRFEDLRGLHYSYITGDIVLPYLEILQLGKKPAEEDKISPEEKRIYNLFADASYDAIMAQDIDMAVKLLLPMNTGSYVLSLISVLDRVDLNFSQEYQDKAVSTAVEAAKQLLCFFRDKDRESAILLLQKHGMTSQALELLKLGPVAKDIMDQIMIPRENSGVMVDA